MKTIEIEVNEQQLHELRKLATYNHRSLSQEIGFRIDDALRLENIFDKEHITHLRAMLLQTSSQEDFPSMFDVADGVTH